MMNGMMDGLLGEDNDFIVEEIDRYKLHYTCGDKKLTCTGNNIDSIVKVYNNIIEKYITDNDDRHMVIYIYDYDKETNIYYYDSDEER